MIVQCSIVITVYVDVFVTVLRYSAITVDSLAIGIRAYTMSLRVINIFLCILVILISNIEIVYCDNLGISVLAVAIVVGEMGVIASAVRTVVSCSIIIVSYVVKVILTCIGCNGLFVEISTGFLVVAELPCFVTCYSTVTVVEPVACISDLEGTRLGIGYCTYINVRFAIIVVGSVCGVLTSVNSILDPKLAIL